MVPVAVCAYSNSVFGCLPLRNILYIVKHHPLVRGENNSLGCHSSDKDSTQAYFTATLHAKG